MRQRQRQAGALEEGKVSVSSLFLALDVLLAAVLVYFLTVYIDHDRSSRSQLSGLTSKYRSGFREGE